MACPELLFKPSLSGLSCASLLELAWKSIDDSDEDVRRDLCRNIILSGGTTMYPGLAERLQSEITIMAPEGIEIKVIAQPSRKYDVWKGASTLCSISSFNSSWISADEYSEHGASIVRIKCGL